MTLSSASHSPRTAKSQARQLQATTTHDKTLASDISLFHKPPRLHSYESNDINKQEEVRLLNGLTDLRLLDILVW